ncbi:MULTISPECIES: ribosome biogenesis GTPase Der [unclassified Hahella]|uniref:ribosome biogenesis GTPase Der n=1 Tax=unclassified Hahella TaxID=2624107 RepID=UPI000FDD58E2|nr:MULTISPECIES: ribosome biogenesis GTPase Der [unclassified Hahella]AZZ93311.1 ribosome biogenesis GTPase Der [Hahella sp. KA22]MBU6952570.1 ribosome biogenesis GTPase Der [Hahella sp. HN01]QAY56685.1 ribosome biogenesis GTPase Der [Hahella sp. KA22]
MKPVIALVGRPNVGKSTLFNRMTRSRDAIVADLPGLTRDRKYGEGELEGKHYIVVDTGGITGEEQGIDAAMAGQSFTAMNEADVVLFVVDAQAGVTPADEMIAKELRVRGKPTILVVNKIDGMQPEVAAADFFAMGFQEYMYTAASHNRGVRSLLEKALEPFPEQESLEGEDDSGIRIGIIGRPNVGKSTLVNRLLGEDRVVVFDQPGTTRDSVYIPYERLGERYTLIDTAGVRRRKNVSEAVEKFSIVKTLQAIKDAHVVMLVLDAREGIVDQDLHLLGFAIEAGRALVLAINKWDGMSQDDKDNVRREIDRRMGFVEYAQIHFISALHGTGVGHLYESVHECFDSAMAKWSTNQLTTLLEDAVSQHQPPMVNGRRIKLRYAHQGGSNPPLIIVHGNQTDALPNSYKRYLENTFRKVLKVVGTPIRFEFRSGENPFAGRKNKLSPRQQKKKERLMKHVKKLKHKQKRKKSR